MCSAVKSVLCSGKAILKLLSLKDRGSGEELGGLVNNKEIFMNIMMSEIDADVTQLDNQNGLLLF